jgi:hypothetical protein
MTLTSFGHNLSWPETGLQPGFPSGLCPEMNYIPAHPCGEAADGGRAALPFAQSGGK